MAVERMGPSDIKGVDVICCRIKLWELSASSLESTARSASCVSPLVHFMCSSPFLTLAGFCSACALNSGSQGDILTVIRRLDENWIEAKSGDKVGVCPLQFTEVSSSAPSGVFSLLVFSVQLINWSLNHRRRCKRTSCLPLKGLDCSEIVTAVLRSVEAKRWAVQRHCVCRHSLMSDSASHSGAQGWLSSAFVTSASRN